MIVTVMLYEASFLEEQLTAIEIKRNRKKVREEMHLRGTIRREGRTENWYSNAKGEVVLQAVRLG